MSRIALLSQLAVAAVLGVLLLAQLDAGPAPMPAPDLSTPSAEPPAALLAGLELEPPPEMPGLEAFEESVERPLFRADRRPQAEDAPTAEATQEPATPAKRPSAELTGVVIVDGRQVAIVDTGGKSRRLEVGDRLDGWEVATIGADQITLANGRTEHVLVLRKFLPAKVSRPARRARAAAERAEAEPEDEDPAAAKRPRRPRQGPRQAARERLERRNDSATR